MAEVLSFDDKTLINNNAKMKQDELECHAFTNAFYVSRNPAANATNGTSAPNDVYE